jgi:hypothetical protein
MQRSREILSGPPARGARHGSSAGSAALREARRMSASLCLPLLPTRGPPLGRPPPRRAWLERPGLPAPRSASGGWPPRTVAAGPARARRRRRRPAGLPAGPGRALGLPAPADPLLVKFSTATRSPLQVHPTTPPRAARACRAQTECWHVVAARPGACVAGHARACPPRTCSSAWPPAATTSCALLRRVTSRRATLVCPPAACAIGPACSSTKCSRARHDWHPRLGPRRQCTCQAREACRDGRRTGAARAATPGRWSELARTPAFTLRSARRRRAGRRPPGLRDPHRGGRCGIAVRQRRP